MDDVRSRPCRPLKKERRIMGSFSAKEVDHKIHPSQAVWQVFEVVMNGWLLFALITQGLTLPLIVWTVMEVGMNAWILITLLKVGIKKSGRSIRLKEL